MERSTTIETGYSPYISLSRDEWSQLRDATPLPLSEEELIRLRGLNEKVSLQDVTDIYLPLSRLLNLYVGATQSLHHATSTFLGNHVAKVPYVIGIAGSVAVGKSTASRIIQALMGRWPNHHKVDLVTTDGFLYPNRILEQRGIMHRKGFPESYDVKKLIQFMADVKSGKPEVHAPVYSHLVYDIVPNQQIIVRNPDIIIIEGLNVLQTNRQPRSSREKQLPRVFVSDFFDFSIYVDAKEEHIKQWYINRFHALRETAFRDSASYFHKYTELTDEGATQTASQIWDDINGLNLRENIEPTRLRADLILEKGSNHSIERVRLRKL